MLFSFFPAIILPVIDPVLIHIGPLGIRWYALSYIAGLLLGWLYIGRLDRERAVFSQRALDDLLLWIIAGVLIGGRLGYVIFYNASYYAAQPLEILAVWKGGMSFHGGLIGVLLSISAMCRVHGLRYLSVMDLLACATPIGIFLGRIANFINNELYGRVTDVPWAVLFPGHAYPRHPSQLYEAGLEGLALFLILWLLVRCTQARQRAGFLSGVFLCGYGLFRSIAEFFREPDGNIGFLSGGMTMGHLLSFPMIMAGAWLVMRALRK